jgi:hypothetical protein
MSNETVDTATKKRIQEQEKLNLEMVDEIYRAVENGMKFVTTTTFDQLLERSKEFNADPKNKKSKEK